MKIADFYETDVYDLLDEKSIVQNITDRSFGYIDSTVNN